MPGSESNFACKPSSTFARLTRVSVAWAIAAVRIHPTSVRKCRPSTDLGAKCVDLQCQIAPCLPTRVSPVRASAPEVSSRSAMVTIALAAPQDQRLQQDQELQLFHPWPQQSFRSFVVLAWELLLPARHVDVSWSKMQTTRLELAVDVEMSRQGHGLNDGHFIWKKLWRPFARAHGPGGPSDQLPLQ